MRIAIVGAGMAGLACADALVERGHSPVLFDKGRGPGGRMSTRRVDAAGETLRFDHGAQYFSVRDPGFAAQVARWERDGVAARWPQAGEDAWVGTPGMNAPVKAMAAGHAVAWNTRVEALTREGKHWHLSGADAGDGFDAVVVAVPAEQAAPLLAPSRADFAEWAANTRSAPCWTAIVAFAEPVETHCTIVRDAGAVGWAARDGSKPGRGDAQTWVVQATPDWSAEHLERTPGEVAPDLLAALGEALGVTLPPAAYLAAHRWRYARTSAAGGPGALWEGTLGLGACGDWLLAPRVEAAWLSGQRLATAIG